MENGLDIVRDSRDIVRLTPRPAPAIAGAGLGVRR